MTIDEVKDKYSEHQGKAKFRGPTYMACSTVLLVIASQQDTTEMVNKLQYYANHTKNGATHKKIYREAAQDIQSTQ